MREKGRGGGELREAGADGAGGRDRNFSKFLRWMDRVIFAPGLLFTRYKCHLIYTGACPRPVQM
jgi:hypothetical protein